MESNQHKERIGSPIPVTKPPTFQLLSKMKRRGLQLMGMGGGNENQKKKFEVEMQWRNGCRIKEV